MEGISCVKPRGAFYVFPNISTYLNTSYKEHEIRTSSDLALYLIKEAQVVLIPGSAFGSDNHLRISFAASMDRLNEGMDRIEHALTNLT
jgi:aspartate aminotransferase